MPIPRGEPAAVLTTSHWPADTSRPLVETTLGDLLATVAAEVPDRLALVEGRSDGRPGRRLTYAELEREAERTAAALLVRFSPGDRVAFWAANAPEWLPVFYGCAKAGIVLVTVNPAYKTRELAYVLEKSEAAGLFVMDAYRGFDALAAVESVRPRLPYLREVVRIAEFDAFLAGATAPATLPTVRPGDAAVIMFTSGTTGAQKGVIFHHRGIVNMSGFTQERGGLAEGGVFVNPMPMFHIGALGHAAVGSVARRATHVLAAEWSPELYMRLVAEEGGTYSLLVPTMIEALLAHPARRAYDLSSLRNLVSGASTVEADLIRRTASELGATICNIYGQTEMQGTVTGVAVDDTLADQAETIGRPLPHAEIKIADPVSGEALPLGETGEIWTRGHQTMIGYYAMPEETAKAITPDGWLRSGDLGSMDARGYLKITGRIKDMIIRGGENVYPREIENLLLEHPQVAAVAVIGIPDAHWGEQIGAVVVAKDPEVPPTADALHAFCRTHLSGFKTPRLWYFTRDFPFTETGKLQKFRLIERVRAGELVATTIEGRPPKI